MKSKFGLIIFFILFCSLLLMPVSCTSSENDNASSGIRWYSYNEGISLGKDKKKKVFINFYADWCGYCKVMEKETFKDNSVVSYLNENFISIRVNSDNDKKTASSYNVSALPATWFLEESGEKLTNLPGYVPPDKMLLILKFINTESYKKMKYSEFIKKGM